MKKLLLSLGIVLALFSPLSNFAETIETESSVTSAIVYINAAQITREAEVKLKAGTQEVMFADVPENLNENTLTVSASGTAQAKILDAKIKSVQLERPEALRVRELEDEILILEEKFTELGYQQDVIVQEREFLGSIKLFARDQIPKDLATKMPSGEELESLNGFLREKWQDTYVRELKIKGEQRVINEKLDKARRELSQLNHDQRKDKRVISVSFDVAKEGTLNILISYLMYQAGWYPEYDARVDYKTQGITLDCMGVVQQTSGEDWQGVELTLSTAKPTLSARMPELDTWSLRPYELHRSYKVGEPQMSFPSEPSELLKTNVPVEIDESKGGEIAIKLYTQTEEKFTSVSYKIARKVDLKSDGTKNRLPIFSEDLKVDFEYSATPKLSNFAYLMAKVTNQREQLLPAGVRIFLDDVYVGTSSIDAVGKGEEFDLYLGIDEGVKVEREKLTDEAKEFWIAGIKRNNKVTKREYKITLENYKDREIKISLFDHFPISENDQIAVKILDVEPKPTQEDYEDKKGVMRWEFSIPKSKKQEINYSYQIEHPQNMHIGL